MAVLRSRLFDVFTLFWSLVFVPPIFTLFQVRRDPAQVRRFSRTWARGMLWGMKHVAGLDHQVRLTGAPAERPVLLVANHQSLWETIAFTVLEPDVTIVAKRSLLKIPFFGWYLKHYPMIFVDRDKPGANLRRMIKEARGAIDEGRSVLIFPEGTRTSPDERRDFQVGLKVLMKALGRDVVPVVHISGAYVDDRRNLKRPGVVLVEYLAPHAAEGDLDRVAADVEAAINAGKDRLLKEARSGAATRQ